MKNKPSDSELMRTVLSLPFHEAALFDVRDIPFEAALQGICEGNACGRYGRAWNCPPAVGSFEGLSAMCQNFGRGIIFSTVDTLDDPFDWEGMMAAGTKLCRLLSELNASVKKTRPAKYKILGSGTCPPCEGCTYPNEPCRHPESLFIPVEACGINVAKLATECGIKYNNGANTVTFFGILLY